MWETGIEQQNPMFSIALLGVIPLKSPEYGPMNIAKCDLTPPKMYELYLN